MAEYIYPKFPNILAVGDSVARFPNCSQLSYLHLGHLLPGVSANPGFQSPGLRTSPMASLITLQPEIVYAPTVLLSMHLDWYTAASCAPRRRLVEKPDQNILRRVRPNKGFAQDHRLQPPAGVPAHQGRSPPSGRRGAQPDGTISSQVSHFLNDLRFANEEA